MFHRDDRISRTNLPAEDQLQVPLGEYMHALFETFVEELGDEDLAEIATLAVIQQRLVDRRLAQPAAA